MPNGATESWPDAASAYRHRADAILLPRSCTNRSFVRHHVVIWAIGAVFFRHGAAEEKILVSHLADRPPAGFRGQIHQLTSLAHRRAFGSDGHFSRGHRRLGRHFFPHGSPCAPFKLL